MRNPPPPRQFHSPRTMEGIWHVRSPNTRTRYAYVSHTAVQSSLFVVLPVTTGSTQTVGHVTLSRDDTKCLVCSPRTTTFTTSWWRRNFRRMRQSWVASQSPRRSVRQFLSQASSFCRSAKCWMCKDFPHKEIHTLRQLETPTQRMQMVPHTLQPLNPGFMTGNLNELKDYTQCLWERFFSKLGFPLPVSFHQYSISVYCRSDTILRTAFLQNTQHAVAQLVKAMRLQAGRIQVRFPILPLEVFINTVLLAALWPWSRLSPNRNKYREYNLGVKAAGAWGSQCFMCRLSSNLGASTSSNTQGLARPVYGLLYLYLYECSVAVLTQMNTVLRITYGGILFWAKNNTKYFSISIWKLIGLFRGESYMGSKRVPERRWWGGRSLRLPYSQEHKVQINYQHETHKISGR